MEKSIRIVLLLVLLYSAKANAQVNAIAKRLIGEIPEVSTAKIIAAGESAHGAAEFAKLKADFFKELVHAGIVKTLFIESNFSAVSLINDWVWHRSNASVDSLMKVGLYPAWRGKDMEDLLTWMRSYNANRPDGEKLSFKGIDGQSAEVAVPIIEAYLASKKVPLPEVVASGLKLVGKMGTNDVNDANDYRKLSKENQSIVDQSVRELRNLVDKHSGGDQAIGLHMKAIEHCLVYQKAGPLKFVNVRDANMAELTLELLKLESKPVFLWAHNGHISKSKSVLYKPLGSRLYKEFSKKYLAIALDFYEGEIKNSYRAGTSKIQPLDDADWIGKDFRKPLDRLTVVDLKRYGKMKIRDVGSGIGTYKTDSNQSFDYVGVF